MVMASLFSLVNFSYYSATLDWSSCFFILLLIVLGLLADYNFGLFVAEGD